MIVSVVFIPTWPTWLTMIGAARRSSERSSVRYPDRVIEPWKKTESRSVCQWVPHLGNRGAGSFIEWRRNCLVRRKGSRVSESQGGGRRGAARVLDDDEIRAIVARNFWGVLSTVGPDGQPYAVPIIYGYDGAFYSVLRDGRKLTNIDANPRVCINVVEIEEMAKRWRSVLAFGTARWIDDDEGMRAAIHVIRAQYPGPPARSGGTTDALRSQGFRVMKLVVDEMTGRAQE